MIATHVILTLLGAPLSALRLGIAQNHNCILSKPMYKGLQKTAKDDNMTKEAGHDMSMLSSASMLAAV